MTADLLYQPVSYSFAEDMRQDGTGLTDRFFGFYDQSAKTPVVISDVQISLR